MMKKSRKILCRNVLIILIASGVLGLILTCALFFGKPDPTRATASIQMSFDGAAEGIAPNGEKYDISELFSDRILDTALKASGLNSKYTVEQIRPHIVIKGVYPEDMASQVMNYESLLSFTANRDLTVGDYYPTTFNISLYNHFDKSISQGDLTNLLNQIVLAYQTHFADTYGYYLKDDFLHFNTDDYDYPQQLDILEVQLQTLEQYAGQLQEKEHTFRSNGAGFSDIRVRLNNLMNNDLARISAELNMNGLTRDTERMMVQYQYELRNLLKQVEKKQVQLANVDKLISSYEKNEIIYLSTSDSLTKIDGNSSETYDFLVDQRKQLADNITDLKSEMDTYQLRMADLLKQDAPELLSESLGAATGADTAAVAESVKAADVADSAKAGTEVTEAEAETAAVESTESENDTEEETVEASDTAGTASIVTVQAAEAETTADMAAEDVISMSEEELAKAAAEAEALSKQRISALEKNISDILVKKANIVSDFKSMLKAYNDQEINELTVTAYDFDYETPNILSGAFAKKAIKTAGPICAIGFILSMILIISTLRKEEKLGKAESDDAR